MGRFNLENYATVNERIEKFITEFPEGSIQTFIRQIEGPIAVIEARVFRTRGDVEIGAYTSGIAREVEGKSNVNSTSHVENCETSAIGRALANLGYGTSKDRASRSEMVKVERMQREMNAFIDFIVDEGKNLTDESKLTINGAEVGAKDYIRANWDAINEQFAVARQVVDALEVATGRKVEIPKGE